MAILGLYAIVSIAIIIFFTNLLIFIFRNHPKFQLLKIGVVLGWKTPTLPEHILTFHNDPLIIIFRVIGGLSMLFLLLNRVDIFPTFLKWYIILICFSFSCLFTIYQYYLAFHRIKHLRFLMKSGAYEIRNSPGNRIITMSSKLVACVKGAWEASVSVSTGLGIMVIYDAVLEHAGHEPLFKSILAKGLNITSPEDQAFEDRIKILYEINNSRKDYFLEEDVKQLINEIITRYGSFLSEDDINWLKDLRDLMEDISKKKK